MVYELVNKKLRLDINEVFGKGGDNDDSDFGLSDDFDFETYIFGLVLKASEVIEVMEIYIESE